MSASAGLRQRAAQQPSSTKESSLEVSAILGEEDLLPFTPPPFTVKDLLGAIPPHCFERSALKASFYIARDFAIIGSLMYGASHIEGNLGLHGKVLSGYEGVAAKWLAWAAYWVFSGFSMTGIWINGHECGHQAFSTSKQLNNAVGLFLHTLLFVPYHSWRISHARHHAATGHMTRDEVFVPHTKSDRVKNGKGTGRKVEVEHGIVLDELLEDAPFYRLMWIVRQQLFGWPAYLIMNASGQKHYPKYTNHFDPESVIFDARHRHQIIISDIALLVMAGFLHLVTQKIGFANLFFFYIIPYIEVNHWLVMITYLQHTDPNLPHYRAGEWTFARGALCTIDRNLLGPVGPYLLHGICETHIAHHISSKIPHYNAWEATEALKNLLGEHYMSTNENMFVSLYKSMGACRYVDDEGDVLFYRDNLGRAQRKAVLVDAVDSGLDVEPVVDY